MHQGTAPLSPGPTKRPMSASCLPSPDSTCSDGTPGIENADGDVCCPVACGGWCFQKTLSFLLFAVSGCGLDEIMKVDSNARLLFYLLTVLEFFGNFLRTGLYNTLVCSRPFILSI